MGAYYTLVASLPNLPPHFDVERPPISRPCLLERLQLLNADDTVVLQKLLDFLAWDRQPLDRTDEQFVRHYEEICAGIANPLVRELVDDRMDVRTLVSALRRRQRGEGPPLGVGRLVRQIRLNWQLPYWGLQTRFSWIEQFAEMLQRGEAVAAERLLYEVNWANWRRRAAEYTFSFEAVLLYLSRWTIIDRWTSQNRDAGRARFEQLIEETLGDYAKLAW